MHCLKLSTFLLVASVSLRCLEAAPSRSQGAVPPDLNSFLVPSLRKRALMGWSAALPAEELFKGKRYMSRNVPMSFAPTPLPARMENLKLSPFVAAGMENPAIGIHVKKRMCNTATCVTQRLADFLSRSNNNLGAFYIPTNVGSNTYGKRDAMSLYSRELFSYLQR